MSRRFQHPSAIGEANRALEAEPGYKARISGLEAAECS